MEEVEREEERGGRRPGAGAGEGWEVRSVSFTPPPLPPQAATWPRPRRTSSVSARGAGTPGGAGGRDGESPQRLLCGGARPGGAGSGAGPGPGGHLGKRKPGAAAPPASPALRRTRLRDLAGRWRRVPPGTGRDGSPGWPRCRGAASAHRSGRARAAAPLPAGASAPRCAAAAFEPQSRVNAAGRGGLPGLRSRAGRGAGALRGRPRSARHMTGGAAAAERS